MLASRDFDVVLFDLLADIGMAKDIVGRGGLLDEEWFVFC